LTEVLGVGEVFAPQRPLAVVHAGSEQDAEQAAREVAAAFEWVEEGIGVPPAPLIHEVLLPSV
jgi:hypothetical protein